MCQLVSALSRLTGGYSTVPPKSVSSNQSFEPIICLPGAFLISGQPHPPKVSFDENRGRSHGCSRYASTTTGDASPHELAGKRLNQYFTIAHTPKEDRVTHILFFGGQEASERWETLKDELKGDEEKNADKVFQVFTDSFEKSSSHWQARDEYLGDIKQTKQQTTAELDLYIKDLVWRCQFKKGEEESRKIDLLYHATLHFEVRKYVHNAKASQLSYYKMIEVAKAHERTCQEYQMHKQAHSGGASNYTNPLLQTSALTKSFQRHPPKRPCGKCGRSHGHGDCPAQGATCNTCGKKNHWSTVCRTRRHSLTGRLPSPGRPQQQRQL